MDAGRMAPAQTRLPQLADEMFLCDTGLETDLIFHHGIDLPEFAAFPLLDDPRGRKALERYYRAHAALAVDKRVGFIFETPTWRANHDWGERVGYRPDDLVAVNRDAVAMLTGLAETVTAAGLPAVVSGCLGPREDAYHPATRMRADEAREYHRHQIQALSAGGAQLVSALTLTYPAEGIGIQAAVDSGVPAAVSFTLETDGRLPDGTTLRDAVTAVDEATDQAAAYFGINCAHPDHIRPALEPGAAWMSRLRALRANASRRSHAELDESADLDDGDPDELGRNYRELRTAAEGLTILGGCCGTDVRHLQAIAASCVQKPRLVS